MISQAFASVLYGLNHSLYSENIDFYFFQKPVQPSIITIGKFAIIHDFIIF